MSGAQQKTWPVLVSLLLIFSGCQSTAALKSTGVDNTGFMSLWGTYTHCKVSSDINDVGSDVQTLGEAAQVRSGPDGFVLPLPKQVTRLISNPTNRYAVDVRAMASACSLHAGQLALDRGQLDVARDMFTSVVSLYPTGESSYYLTQAKTHLSEIENGIPLSLNTP